VAPTLQSVSLSDGSGAFRSPINPRGHDCQQQYNSNTLSLGPWLFALALAPLAGTGSWSVVGGVLSVDVPAAVRQWAAQPPQRGDWTCLSCTHPLVHMRMLMRGSLCGPAETVQPCRPVQAVQTVCLASLRPRRLSSMAQRANPLVRAGSCTCVVVGSGLAVEAGHGI
jgi:hypothetical protein